MSNDWSFHLPMHFIQFEVEAIDEIRFGVQIGAQLRGALWEAMSRFACTEPGATSAEHRQHCPMCRLMAYENDQSLRGATPPRMFAIRPPLVSDCYERGERFKFAIVLFGDNTDLFPYLVQGVKLMGENGVGYRRGRFIMRRIDDTHPLNGASVALLQENGWVNPLRIAISLDDVAIAASKLNTEQLTVNFLTPTYITGEMLKNYAPPFDTLIARIIERCESLEMHYTDSAMPREFWRERYMALTQLALSVHLQQDHTQWRHVESGSKRTGRMTAMSGIVGRATYVGNLDVLRFWLLWGSLTQVGKNVVKGNGWYTIEI